MVSPLGLGVALGGSLKVGGGYVIEQKVKGAAEQLAVTLLQMKAQGILVGEQCIQSAIEPVVVDLFAGNPQHVVQSSLSIPKLGYLQFRRGCAKAGKN